MLTVWFKGILDRWFTDWNNICSIQELTMKNEVFTTKQYIIYKITIDETNQINEYVLNEKLKTKSTLKSLKRRICKHELTSNTSSHELTSNTSSLQTHSEKQVQHKIHLILFQMCVKKKNPLRYFLSTSLTRSYHR